MDDYISIPASTLLNFTSGDFSIISIVKVNDLSSDRMIFNRGGYIASGYWFRLGLNENVDFYTWQSGAGQESTSANGSIVVNTWYTLGISRSGASVRCYINGVDATSIAGTHIDPATCSDAAEIGSYQGSTQFFKGFIGELLIYNRALTPLEIQNHYLASKWRYQ